jgi:hypothetical protein
MALKFDVGFSEDENLKWRKSMEVGMLGAEPWCLFAHAASSRSMRARWSAAESSALKALVVPGRAAADALQRCTGRAGAGRS